MTRAGPPLHPYPKAKLKLPPQAVCVGLRITLHTAGGPIPEFFRLPFSKHAKHPFSHSQIKFLTTLAGSMYRTFVPHSGQGGKPVTMIERLEALPLGCWVVHHAIQR